MSSYGLAVPTYKRDVELKKLLVTIPEQVPVYISDNGATLPISFEKERKNTFIQKVATVVPMFPNWNLAASSVKEEWLAIPSDDDIYYPGAFEIIDRCLGLYADADMIVFGHNIIDENEKILSSWTPKLAAFDAPAGFSQFQYGVDARMPSIFIKRELFHRLNGLDENFSITAADSDILQRLALVGKVQFVPEIISGYRVWEGGTTQKRIASKEWMNDIEYWCKRIAEFSLEQKIDLDMERIGDEIFARNLMSGILAMKKQNGYIAAWRYFLEFRFPRAAMSFTKIRLLALVMRP